MTEFTTEKFSGPLGLLLNLIDQEELDITEISLAKIADQYVEYIRSAVDINPEEMADFLLLASKLLFAKSKALLPYLYVGEEDDEIDDLERQLKMYKEFVEASKKIKDTILKKNFLFLPPLSKSRRHQFDLPVFNAPTKIDTSVLKEEFLKIVSKLEKRVEKKLPEEKLESKVSIDDKIGSLRQMIVQKVRVSFSKFLRTAKDKTEMVVSFLAVLELIKQKELVFEQEDLFSEIHIKRNI